MAWNAWLEDQWNTPDRHDYYLMRIAQALGGGQLSKYRIRWGRPATGQTEDIKTAAARVAAQARRSTASRLGIPLPSGLGSTPDQRRRPTESSETLSTESPSTESSDDSVSSQGITQGEELGPSNSRVE